MRPSSQPSAQPSRQPMKRPSSQPSRQPSRQPTCHPSKPSSQPSNKPSIKSTSRPTRKPKSSKPTYAAGQSPPPTSQPSNYPSSKPSGSRNPTRRFSAYPTSRPTSRPSPEGGFTAKPTTYYSTMKAYGRVTFDPDSASFETCVPSQLEINITFTKNLIASSTFTIATPGLTSGNCYEPIDGPNIASLYLPNQYKNFIAAYYEGSHLNNYASSRIVFTVLQNLTIQVEQYIFIDRLNKLKRTCSSNNTWAVTASPYNQASGVIGSLIRSENYPKKCYQFSSKLNFSVPYQQFATGINISMYLSFSFASDTSITIYLPGFTNKAGAYGLNVLKENSTDFIGDGYNTRLCNMTWNTNFSWVGNWYEGSYSDNYKNSYIVLYAMGRYHLNVPFWINIDRGCNHLFPVCGSSRNSSNFQIAVSSDYFYTVTTPITVANAIGTGCDHLNNCNGNGYCDYCSSSCVCNNGFGSTLDLNYTIVNDFKPDCSYRSCPTGRSLANIYKFRTGVNYTATMHPQIECSNNGICDRSTGQCKCNPGMEGRACEKMQCPGTPKCSGRGTCYSMRRLARKTTALPLTLSSVEYVYFFNETTWDADFGHVCLCDSSWSVGLGSNQTQQAEYFGAACQYKRCPTGDDPMTMSVDETDCYGVAAISGGQTGSYGNKCHVDCSNRGICDHDTGLCKCFTGFTGGNCGTLAIV